MTENTNSGAQDWRSELEKRKSLLRKSAIALFKTWIPDHAEASMARGEVFSLFQASTHQYSKGVTFVNQLSFGSEDITAHDFAADPISLQELLVQREGTDAFLDAKNALRVVRRKFGMMTLISRMASTMEQRNIASVRVQSDIDQETILKFGRLMSRRIEGTSTEEEEEFKRQIRRLDTNFIDVLFHGDVIGRKVPVPWLVKEVYSKLSLITKREGQLSGERLNQFFAEQGAKLNSKSIRQLALYCSEMRQDLGEGLNDPFPNLLKASNERFVLTAARNMFDEFNELRQRQKQKDALLQSGEHQLTSNADAAELEDENTDFTTTASEVGGDESEELTRLGRALDLVREIMGRAFFVRISMVSGDLNFADAVSGRDAKGSTFEADTLANPLDALRQARAISEPLYRCQHLCTVTSTLVSAGRFDDAMAAASEALDASRKVPTDDRTSAYAVTIRALIETEQPELSATAVTEAINSAHNVRDLIERSGALVRVASTIIETGTVPIVVKRAASRAILGPDVHFWGKAAVKPALVESVISMLSSKEDDSLIFLQKVIVHADPSVRCSVVRTMPLEDAPHLESMLLGHLKDHDESVRLEVMERLGSSSQIKFAVYLANAIRKGEYESDAEKRSLAINLGRLDPERQYHVYNAMLGRMGIDDPKMSSRMPRLKDDEGLQLAALECLHHLRSREARRIMFHASTEGKGSSRMKKKAAQLWELTKNVGYSEPCFPRSFHDPEWSDEDSFDFESFLAEAPSQQKNESKAQSSAGGVVGWVKGLFNSTNERSSQIGPLNPSSIDRSEAEAESTTEPEDLIEGGAAHLENGSEDAFFDSTEDDSISAQIKNPTVGLRIEAMVQRSSRAWTGDVPMVFAFHGSPESEDEPLYSETRDEVRVTAGRFEIIIGEETPLPTLPKTLWLEVTIDGQRLDQRLHVTPYRSVIQG